MVAVLDGAISGSQVSSTVCSSFGPDQFWPHSHPFHSQAAFAVSPAWHWPSLNDDGRMGGFTFHLSDQGRASESIDFGHLAVHENQRVGCPFVGGDRLLAIAGHVDPIQPSFSSILHATFG